MLLTTHWPPCLHPSRTFKASSSVTPMLCCRGRWPHLVSLHSYLGTLALAAFLASTATAAAHNLGYPGKIKAPKVGRWIAVEPTYTTNPFCL